MVLSNNVAQLLLSLPATTFHEAWLPLSVFSFIHGVRVTLGYKKALAAEVLQANQHHRFAPLPPWGQGLLAVLAMSLGGGFSASLLLGNPPSWLGSNVAVPAYSLAYFLVQYTPFGDLIDSIPAEILEPILIIADGSLRGLSIAKTGIEASRAKFPPGLNGTASDFEPWFAMILCGVLAGCGGGLWADLLKLKSYSWNLTTTPGFLKEATWDIKAAFLGAVFYATSTSPKFHHAISNGSISTEAAGAKGGHYGGLMESSEAQAMTMLLVSTLLLGKYQETRLQALSTGTLRLLNGTFFTGSTSLSSSSHVSHVKKSSKSKRSTGGDDDEEEETLEEETEEEFELKQLEREQAEDEQDEDYEVEKSTKGRRSTSSRKSPAGSTKTSRKTTTSSVTVSSSETPKRGSSRARRSTRTVDE